MSWFLIILALLDFALLSVCCLIHCKHLRLSDVNKHTYLLTYLTLHYKRFNSALACKTNRENIITVSTGVVRTLLQV